MHGRNILYTSELPLEHNKVLKIDQIHMHSLKRYQIDKFWLSDKKFINIEAYGKYSRYMYFMVKLMCFYRETINIRETKKKEYMYQKLKELRINED